MSLLAGGLLALIPAGCNELVSSMGEQPSGPQTLTPSVPQYPIQRTLTDLQGRQIEAKITGRTSSAISMYRVGDESVRIYNYPIDQLDPIDQQFVRSLPIGGAKDGRQSVLDQSTLQNQLEEIKSLQSEIQALQSASMDAGLTQSQRSLLVNKVERHQRDLARAKDRYRELGGTLERW